MLQQHGSKVTRSSPTFAKSDETALVRLEKRAFEIAMTTGCDLSVALRKARQERPYLVQAANSA